MPRICTGCAHPDRSGIDAAIVAGQANRRIATQHGLTEAAVRRHKAHVPVTLAKAAEAKEAARADDLLAAVVALRQRLTKALDDAQAAKDVASLGRELRETLRLMLELEGRLRHGAQVQVALSLVQSPEWVNLMPRIMQALGPYPEARRAVRAVAEEMTQ